MSRAAMSATLAPVDETQPLQASPEQQPAAATTYQELRWLSAASLPLIGTYYLHYTFGFLNLVSLGIWGGKALGAYALASLTYSILAFAPATGIASALDTLCAASFARFGGSNQVGLHLQRGLLAITLWYSAVLFVIHVPLAYIYELLGQDQDLAQPAISYMKILSLGLWPWMAFECLKRFVQANTQMRIPTMVLAATVPMHALNHWYFIWKQPDQISFTAVAWITVASYWAMFIGLVACTLHWDALRFAWNIHSLKQLISADFYSLALPAMIESCGEYMAFELMALFATYMGPYSLAAQAIAFNSMSMMFQLPHGVGGAAAVRVGQLLGRGRSLDAKFSAKVLVISGLVYSIIGTLFYTIYGERWVAMYTSDEEVLVIARKLIKIVALLEWTDASRGIIPGILRAMGKQKKAAIINISSYYFVVLPTALFAIYGLGMDILGLWFAFAIGMSVLSGCYIATVAATDWNAEAELCASRITTHTA